MSSSNYIMSCPFCGYSTDAEYAIMLHMEETHPEGSDPTTSPAVAGLDLDACGPIEGREGRQQNASSEEDAERFVECPIEGCLEQILLDELDEHVGFHAMEESEVTASAGAISAAAADVEIGPSSERQYQSPYSGAGDTAHPSREHHRRRHRRRSRSPDASAADAWKKLFNLKPARNSTREVESRPVDEKAPSKRLGRSELGKHAYEDKMPDSLASLLKRGKYTSAEGIIPVLAKLLEQNSETEYAYLCHSAVQHISKLRREGGFCGYRNIQMLASYIVGARLEDREKLGDRIPNIFQIQDYIENAWDMGFNASGRIETGGIRGTRKYIGTPEAQAMFVGLGIPCEAEALKSHKHSTVEAALLASVQRYFENAAFDPKDKVRCTNLAPMYFQHRGHSLTIVGLEQRVSGSLKLLVFDPMFRDPEGIIRLVRRVGQHGDGEGNRGKSSIHYHPDSALQFYRRGHHYLRKYHEFEILRLKISPPQQTPPETAQPN